MDAPMYADVAGGECLARSFPLDRVSLLPGGCLLEWHSFEAEGHAPKSSSERIEGSVKYIEGACMGTNCVRPTWRNALGLMEGCARSRGGVLLVRFACSTGMRGRDLIEVSTLGCMWTSTSPLPRPLQGDALSSQLLIASLKLGAGLMELFLKWWVVDEFLIFLSSLVAKVIDHAVGVSVLVCGGSVESSCADGLCRGANKRPNIASLTKMKERPT
ncbi:hypothetical protein CRG98_007690 [Punica granatum]|uniref:Uncharacterized protein n=1 Tax=Punica granatum TaxID=22663 RepID=A0A2I0KTX3_PUNGR|nr:hypothetical protein CRG98_007690 [Punica granatum]